jgi:hypothetical protein
LSTSVGNSAQELANVIRLKLQRQGKSAEKADLKV